MANLKELIRPYYLRWIYFRMVPGSRPPYFESCWQYPFRRVNAPGLAEFCPAPGGGRDVVWYPMTDWHTRRQRTQHLAHWLAELGCRGLYLNPHLGREFETVYAADRPHRVALLEPNLMELHVRLPREPVFHHRMLAPEESRVVAGAVEAWLDTARSRGAVQIVSLPVWLDAALDLRARRGYPIIYDCHDLLSGFSNMSPDIVDAEERLFVEADRVVFSSQALFDRHPSVHRKALLLRNGVDVSRFASTGQADRRERHIGYIGAIEGWFDIAAVRQAAHDHPDCHFTIAGRIENAAAAALRELANVEMPGEIDYDRVPDLLRQFDVGIIPFAVNDLTRAADPIKLYEYFACGIPVVSSALPEVEKHGELVYLASSPAEFARAVHAALHEADPELCRRRIEVARQASWRERARELQRAVMVG